MIYGDGRRWCGTCKVSHGQNDPCDVLSSKIDTVQTGVFPPGDGPESVDPTKLDGIYLVVAMNGQLRWVHQTMDRNVLTVQNVSKLVLDMMEEAMLLVRMGINDTKGRK